MKRRFALWSSLLAVPLLAWVAAAQPKVLYEKVSAYNTIVVTEDAQGLRTLQFEPGGARQSVVKVGDPDHIELPYARSLMVSLALVTEPQRVLVIGLGGGTIPGFLHKHYPQAMIDSVDIDPEVVEVAKQFFGFREDQTLRAHVEDGRKFIEECAKPYDLIILDAFGTESIPYHLATREFLQSVRRALTPRGLAVGNIWSRYSNPLYDSMVRTYLDVFDQLYILEVPGAGNELLFALPRKESIEQGNLAQQAGKLSQAKKFPFELAPLVHYGFRSAEKENARGRVLTDAAKNKKAD